MLPVHINISLSFYVNQDSVAAASVSMSIRILWPQHQFLCQSGFCGRSIDMLSQSEGDGALLLLLLNLFRKGNPSAEAGFQGAFHLHTYIQNSKKSQKSIYN